MNKRKILVPLGDKSYEVTLEAGILNNISEELLRIGITKNRKILVISNEEISNLYGEKFLNNLKDNKFQAKMFLIKAGESYKNLKTLSEIYDVAFEFGLDRNSIIIALGGGIVGDVSGFAAATWLRGIEYIQIPTTLLSMVDSSVGGKTGVNHPKGKNLIGAFNQPKAVFIDPETLKSLPKREFSAGMAEVIKYGVIRDKELFEYLEIEKNKNELINLKNEYLIKIINSSIKTKSHIVSQDEHENGVRAILNYGHSFGHVIENLCGYGKFLHGEAISIGMNIAGEIAIEKGLWSKEELERQKNLLKSYDLPTEIPKINKEDGVIRDKELFEYLEIEKNKNELINLKNEYLIKIISSSIKTKSHIVSQDEYENGVRAILNYGHSFGHVIENLCGYGKFLHGEAISIGMNIAGKIAIEKGLWSKEELERQRILLESYDLPTEIPKINKEDVLTILMGDKKVRDGKMRFILPKEIGAVDIYDDVEDSLFLKFFS